MKKFIFLMSFLMLLAVGCSSEKGNVVSQMPNALGCSQLSQQQIINDIGASAPQYELGQNAGYSPDNCHYAISVYFSGKVPLSNSNQLSNKIVGTWLIDTKSNVSRRITNINEYNSNFKDWISDTQLELMPDNDNTTSIYDITSNSIVSTSVINITFQFNIKDDAQVTVTPTDTTDAACSVSRSSVQELFDYSYACIQKSDFTMSVAGYKTFEVHYINPNAITVNGKIYNVLPTTATVIKL